MKSSPSSSGRAPATRPVLPEGLTPPSDLALPVGFLLPAGFASPTGFELTVDSQRTGIPVRRATTFRERAIGLLGRSPAAPGVVLELRPCAAVHSFGMRIAIDVAFVEADGRIRRLVSDLPPWRLAWCRGAAAVWELPVGMARVLGLQVGQRLGAADGNATVTAPCHSMLRLSVSHSSLPPPPPRPPPQPSQPSQPSLPSVSSPQSQSQSQPQAPSPTQQHRPSPHRVSLRMPASHRRASRSTPAAGVALVEFLLAGILVLLPLTFATLELAQLVVARHALDYATFEAARTGAVSGASEARMRVALARALVPLFAPVDAVAVLRGRGADTGVGVSARALARATAEVLRPDLMRLRIENPTAAAAADFAENDDTGRRVIPNDGLDVRNPLGATSGQTLREANVLAIRVRYCRRLFMPLIRDFVPALLRAALPDPFDQLCLAQRRVPIDARAVVHMQSPVDVAALPPG